MNSVILGGVVGTVSPIFPVPVWFYLSLR